MSSPHTSLGKARKIVNEKSILKKPCRTETTKTCVTAIKWSVGLGGKDLRVGKKTDKVPYKNPTSFVSKAFTWGL